MTEIDKENNNLENAKRQIIEFGKLRGIDFTKKFEMGIPINEVLIEIDKIKSIEFDFELLKIYRS